MDIFLAWLLIASVQLAATMSPGPAFVFTVRNSMIYDRRIGILTSLGLGLGVAIHVLFVLAGISLLISQSPLLFNFIKYAGAAYLVYIGVKSLRAQKKKVSISVNDDHKNSEKHMYPFKAIVQGILTNLLNPKAIVFFTAVLVQFIDVTTPLWIQILYLVTCSLIEFLWFVVVAVVLTNPTIKARFMRIMHWVERVCGGLMVGLGVKLALSK